jgi:hypothetical protein
VDCGVELREALCADYEFSGSSCAIPFKQTLAGRFEAEVIHLICPLALIYFVNHAFRHAGPLMCFLLASGGGRRNGWRSAIPIPPGLFLSTFRDGYLKDGRRRYPRILTGLLALSKSMKSMLKELLRPEVIKTAQATV